MVSLMPNTVGPRSWLITQTDLAVAFAEWRRNVERTEEYQLSQYDGPEDYGEACARVMAGLLDDVLADQRREADQWRRERGISRPTGDTAPVYASARDDGGAVLRCVHCVEWEADIDGTSAPDVERSARDHVADPEHTARMDGAPR
jgi:hypothetical protein